MGTTESPSILVVLIFSFFGALLAGFFFFSCGMGFGSQTADLQTHQSLPVPTPEDYILYGRVWDPQTQQVVPFPYNLSDKYTFKVLVLEYLNDKGSGTAGDEGNLPERDSVLLDKVAQENLESGKNTVRVRGSNPQEALYTFMEFADPDLGSQINHFQLELSIVKFNKGSYGIATAAEGTVYSVCIVTSTPGKQHIEKDIDGVYHIVTDEPEIRYLFDDNHRPNEIEQDS